MEKKKRGGSVGLVAAAGVALLLAGGFGGGAGLGAGEALPAASDQVIEQSEEAVKEEATVSTVTIEVKEDEYIVDGTIMKLDEIESMIHQADMYQAAFVLVDNYASAKAWDDVVGLLSEHGISVVQQ